MSIAKELFGLYLKDIWKFKVYLRARRMYFKKNKTRFMWAFLSFVLIPVLLWLIFDWLLCVVIAIVAFMGLVRFLCFGVVSRDYIHFRDTVFLNYKAHTGNHQLRLEKLHRELVSHSNQEEKACDKERYRAANDLLFSMENRIPILLERTFQRKRLSLPVYIDLMKAYNDSSIPLEAIEKPTMAIAQKKEQVLIQAKFYIEGSKTKKWACVLLGIAKADQIVSDDDITQFFQRVVYTPNTDYKTYLTSPYSASVKSRAVEYDEIGALFETFGNQQVWAVIKERMPSKNNN